jgi:hypothetical protein
LLFIVEVELLESTKARSHDLAYQGVVAEFVAVGRCCCLKQNTKCIGATDKLPCLPESEAIANEEPIPAVPSVDAR